MFSRLSLLLLSLLFLAACTGSTRLPRAEREIPVATYPPMPPVMMRDLRKKDPVREKEVVVVIDAGHGGDDFGTHSNTKPKYQEKHLNLATAQMLRTFLNQKGFKTLMTRTDDTFISLENRAEFANAKGCHLFVSVHYNSAPSKEAEGVEVFFYRSDKNKERSRESKILAGAVLNQVLDQTQAKSRGVKHGNFAVIRETTMPAILIEGGFLTNDQEMLNIKDPAYIKKIAWGISKGIAEYLENKN